jgi:hypothetical protein
MRKTAIAFAICLTALSAAACNTPASTSAPLESVGIESMEPLESVDPLQSVDPMASPSDELESPASS